MIKFDWTDGDPEAGRLGMCLRTPFGHYNVFLNLDTETVQITLYRSQYRNGFDYIATTSPSLSVEDAMKLCELDVIGKADAVATYMLSTGVWR